MSTDPAQHRAPVYLKDYRPPAFLVKHLDLSFDLFEESVSVRSRLECVRNRAAGSLADSALVLNGRDLCLKSLQLEGRPLPADLYSLDDQTLTIFNLPDLFSLEIETEIYPQKNSALEGLYRSGGHFCTQCEAEGFRKITYFPDRPDVLATYTVTITADRERYPVLLANGNLREEGTLPEARHFAIWEDPFPKPSYLFALVAGNLFRLEDSFRTCSGREVLLQIYVEHHNRHKAGHAMQSLQKAMAWDERTFGLEYDLDRYMIVAVDDFNMGAMENKGLNVFNSKYVLADSRTATDTDYENIEAVVAHEYFHNWTGNRVTCRDWFQLSLKEGLTVYRDQLFSAEMLAGPVKRIHDVMLLRNVQFPEDNSPVAHPVKPDSYIEINNFYTVTVYEKGAEIIRMLHTLLGTEKFKEGLARYLRDHDGRAATTEDFVRAMEEVSGRELEQFTLWYSQAGTPELRVRTDYDAGARTYTLTMEQSCPPTPGQPRKKPVHLPLVLGFLDQQGKEMTLRLSGEGDKPEKSRLLELRQAVEHFRFEGVEEKPVPSLLRNFSAPVKMQVDYSDAELRLLMTHDPDSFNRWEAWQRLALRRGLDLIAAVQQGRELHLDQDLVQGVEQVLRDDSLENKAFVATLLRLPTEEYLAEQLEVIDVDGVHQVRQYLKKELARRLRDQWLQTYHRHRREEPYRYEPGLAGERTLKNLALSYLMALEDDETVDLCLDQLRRADNMTDQFSAFRALAHSSRPEKFKVQESFYRQWRQDVLVLDKWFSVLATAPFPETLNTVKELLVNPDFQIRNPNRVRALIGAFASNPVCFHDRAGAGYRFLGDQILTLNSLNPQIAARLAGRFSRWRRYDRQRQLLMREQLERILGADKLSRDVYEVVSKSLGKSEGEET